MFRFTDRWQTSLAQAWERADPRNDELMRLLELRDQQLEDWLNAAGAWQTPTLVNSWVNYGTPYEAASYRLERADVLRLQGGIKDGTLNTTAFTLPAGFRPAKDHRIASADGVILITSAGVVAVYGASNTLFCLDHTIALTSP